ncbi:hypothetical protein [Bradyrhizobium arachidis]|uniref:hypothetical protein n=1 Tax=Bradyrhizobium arachidis TaxID=858423 RepID=UPI002162A8DF|nr:hypothetical protein [Bradyrhizobium arachidis]UVO28558.1 hypothetical protein KUF59_39925 [Bradyrhizobium arachidis]
MAFKNEHTRIEAFGSADKPAAGKNLVDESVLHLARLIGRQIAREEFERRHGKATRPFRRKGELTT